MFSLKNPRSLAVLCSSTLSLVLAASTPAVSAPDKSAASTKLKVTEINLVSSANGIYKFYIGDNAMRLESPSFGLKIFSAAPDWQVYAVRDKQKEIATASQLQWQKTIVPSFTMAGICQELQKPVRSLPLPDGTMQHNYALKTRSEMFWQSGADRQSISGAQITTMPVKHMDARAIAILNHFLNLPPLPGVPLKMTTIYASGEKRWQLKPGHIKQADMSAGDLLPPKAGYKNVGLITKDFLGKSAMTTFDGLSEMLGDD